MSLLATKNKVFMKRYSKEANIQLIKLVEQNECLWNCKHWKYFDKTSLADAWKRIANELNDSPRKTQHRWRTIRNMFGKSIHPKLNHSSKYYLDEYLDFLRPFIRSCCRSKTCCHLGGRSKQTNTEEPVSEHENQYEIIISNDETSSDKAMSVSTEETDQISEPIIFKELEKVKSVQISSNVMFLESLLPFVNDMTSSQNRRFKLKVLTMVDKILG